MMLITIGVSFLPGSPNKSSPHVAADGTTNSSKKSSKNDHGVKDKRNSAAR